MAKTKRPSRHEILATTIAQDYAHQNTAVITSHQRVVQCEAEEVDKAIVNLQAALTNARERRAKLTVMIDGLVAVISKRG